MSPIILHEKRKCECSSEIQLFRTQPSDPELKTICDALILKNNTLKQIMCITCLQMNRKNSESPRITRTKVKDTFIKGLPKGNEKGKYLVLDVPEKNFRILYVEINEKKILEVKSRDYQVPKKLLCGDVIALFDYFTECLELFLKKENLLESEYDLAFCFLKHLHCTSLTCATVKRWSKDFVCPGLLGNNVVQYLAEAIERKGLNIKVCLITDEATGALMSRAFKYSNCKIGVVNDDYCSLSFLEKTEIKTEPKINNPNCYEEGLLTIEEKVLDIDIGSFGDDGCLDCIQTYCDRVIDKQSTNQGKFIFEKMVSHKYLGEIVRIALVHLIDACMLFRGKMCDLLRIKGCFPTYHLYEIEGEEPGIFDKLREILEFKYGIKYVCDHDCNNVKYICEIISFRSAHLLAAGIAAVLNKIYDGSRIIISIDGDIYKYHPHYHNYLKEKLKELVDEGIKFDLVSANDRRGVGVAIAAAVVRQLQESEEKEN